MVRLIGLPTRETNSSHASSSPDPAQRHTTSFKDKDEYRVVRVVLDIKLFLIGRHQQMRQSARKTKGTLVENRDSRVLVAPLDSMIVSPVFVKSLSSLCQQCAIFALEVLSS